MMHGLANFKFKKTPIHLHCQYKLPIYLGGCQTPPVFKIFWTPVSRRHLSHDGPFCLSKSFQIIQSAPL